MRKPKNIKEMYQRFSELCAESVCLNRECKYLIMNRYWFSVPIKVKGLLGYDWTLADIRRRYESITITNTAMDKRKNWCYTYEKNI